MRRSEPSSGEEVIEKKRRGKVEHRNWSLPLALIIRRQAKGQESSQHLWSEGKGGEEGEKMEEKEGGREGSEAMRKGGRVGNQDGRRAEEGRW